MEKKIFEPITIASSKDVFLSANRNQPKKTVADLLPIRNSLQRMFDARNLPEIKKLVSVIWQTNELHILFADTGIGKSILAMAISDALSKGENFLFLENENKPATVLYYDFELSDRQFRKRYTDDFGYEHQFNERFYIDTIDFAELLNIDPSVKFSETLFNKICYDIETLNADVLVIDNLTYLNSQSTQDTQIAMDVMRELNILKKKYNLSILVLAHTPKRSLSSPISINDLAGSKHLSNFADSISSIGKSAYDSSIRYLKQIKPSRSGEMIYDTENVITCKIVKDGCFLTFEFIDFDNEYDHLKEMGHSEKDVQRNDLKGKAKKMREEGLSLSKISLEIFGTEKSKSTICRWLKETED